MLNDYHAALGDSSPVSKAHSSALPATASWCSSTIRCPVPTLPTGQCGWPWRCGGGLRGCQGWARRGPISRCRSGSPRVMRRFGRIGFEGRFDYAAIGTVTNLAARLCSEADPWQIVVTQRVQAAAEHIVVSEPLGDLDPPRLLEAGRGLQHPRPQQRGDDVTTRSIQASRSARWVRVTQRGTSGSRRGCPRCGGSCVSTWKTSPSSSSRPVTVDRVGERSGTLVQAYEERFLFLLLLLRQPRSASCT